MDVNQVFVFKSIDAKNRTQIINQVILLQDSFQK